jgi:hypothetical protein
MTDNNYFDNFPSTKSYGPHVLYIKITTSSKAMRVYVELYLSVMGALTIGYGCLYLRSLVCGENLCEVKVAWFCNKSWVLLPFLALLDSPVVEWEIAWFIVCIWREIRALMSVWLSSFSVEVCCLCMTYYVLEDLPYSKSLVTSSLLLITPPNEFNVFYLILLLCDLLMSIPRRWEDLLVAVLLPLDPLVHFHPVSNGQCRGSLEAITRLITHKVAKAPPTIFLHGPISLEFDMFLLVPTLPVLKSLSLKKLSSTYNPTCLFPLDNFSSRLRYFSMFCGLILH